MHVIQEPCSIQAQVNTFPRKFGHMGIFGCVVLQT